MVDAVYLGADAGGVGGHPLHIGVDIDVRVDFADRVASGRAHPLAAVHNVREVRTVDLTHHPDYVVGSGDGCSAVVVLRAHDDSLARRVV